MITKLARSSVRFRYMLLLWVSGISACSEKAPLPPSNASTEAQLAHDDSIVHSPSAHYLLGTEDLDVFQPGRQMREILEQLSWRGNLEMMAMHEGREYAAISFGIYGGPFSDDPRATIIWALFTDGRFNKFVNWPDWGKERIHIGNFSRLVKAVESDPVNLAKLMESPSEVAPKEVDLGLTVAALVTSAAGAAALERDFTANAALRNQFNAARLSLGMTTAEVDRVFRRARPLGIGDYADGTYRIYGAEQHLGVMPYLHYSNVLVLFNEQGVAGVYSGYTVPGGEQWREKLGDSFVELADSVEVKSE